MKSDNRRKLLLKNATFLLLAQGSNYIVPLITLPVLVTRLQPQGFGVIAFAQAVSIYIQLLADYGFSISATRYVAIHASSPTAKLRDYVSTIHACKGLLVLIASIIALPILYLWSGGGEAFVAGLLVMGSAVGNALTPLWYYQGVNRIRTVAVATAASKWVGAVAILLFVRAPTDMLFVACAYSVPPLLVALACTISIDCAGIFKFNAIDFRAMRNEMRIGAPYFLISAGTGVLANSGVIVLGIFYPTSVVGIYAAAEKVVKAAVGCIAPISQSVYPLNAERFGESTSAGFRSVRQTALWLLCPAVAGTAILFLIAPWGLGLLHWVDPLYLRIIRYLCPWIVLGVINNVLGIQVLSAMGRGKTYARAFFIAACSTLILMFSLTPAWGGVGIVFGMVGGEFILMILLMWSIRSIVSGIDSQWFK